MALKPQSLLVLTLALSTIGPLAGCGKDRDLTQTNAVSAGDKAFVVVMGGRTSCGETTGGQDDGPTGLGMYTPFKALRQRLESTTGQPLSYVLTCYDTGSQVHFLTGDHEPVQIGDRSALAGALAAELRASAPTQVYIMGHSYGGWLALETVLQWSGAPRVTALFSIDPISQVDCTFTHPLGCMRFPDDIDAAHRAQIAANVTTWENFYEQGTFYLHASAVDQATVNTLVDGATHYTINTNQTVWDHINNRVFGGP